MSVERCAWKGCRQIEIHLYYRGKPLCVMHWLKLCDMQEAGRGDQALEKIGLLRRKRHRPASTAT